MSGISERLRWAIFEHQEPEGKSRGIGLLMSKLNARAKRESGDDGATFLGATYPTIGSYLREEDPTTPPLEFLTAVADELNVGRRWLCWGDAYPTHEAAEVAGVEFLVRSMLEKSEWLDAISRGIVEARMERETAMLAVASSLEKEAGLLRAKAVAAQW